MNAMKWRSGKLGMVVIAAALLLATFNGFALPQATATPSASISFTKPDGQNDYVDEGNDFATQILADPWDFEEMYHDMHPNDLSDISFQNGTLSASIAGTSPYFFLLFGETRHPIDATRYQRAAFHLCVDTERERGGVVVGWIEGGTHSTNAVWLDSECQVVVVDLAAYSDWNGTVTGLFIDLQVLNVGDSFTIDWFRLTERSDWSNSYEFQWENLEATVTPDSMELYLDADSVGNDGFLIATILDPQSSGSVNWGVPDPLDPAHPLPLPQDLQPGTYYVYAVVNGTEPAGYSSHPVEVITPQASIDFVTPADPGGYYAGKNFVGEGSDYATQAWADPWSFDEVSDLIRSHSLNGTTAVDGTLTAEIGGIDPYFFLLFPGLPSAINLNTGDQRPIDASEYTRASFLFCTDVHRMFQQARLYWYEGYTNGIVHPSRIILLESGCNLYIHDLSNQTGWQGDITGLRFDLDYLETGDDFSIDWFRLTKAPDWSNSYQIWWTELDPTGKPLQLFLDPDASGYDGHMIAELFDAPGMGSVDWGSADTGLPLPQDFQPGPYYVYAMVGGQPAGYSSAPIVINRAPAIHFANPNYTTGRDYATNQGNPWDMDSSGTDGVVGGSIAHRFEGGQVIARNTGGDPGFQFNVPIPIDTSYYRYFTIELQSQYSFYDARGGMARLYWMNDYYHPTTTEDLVINATAQWRTYSLDLSQTPLEPGRVQSPWSSSDWQILRFDPNENVTGIDWEWRIRDAKLTGPPEADPYIPIQWEIDNPEDEDVLLTLYYDTDNRGLDGIQIEQGASASVESSKSGPAHSLSRVDAGYYVYLPSVTHNYCPGDCVVWDTSDIAKGEYFIYACLDDGVNHICRYSDVPVLVR